MEEIWMPCVYDGVVYENYLVSNKGNVKSLNFRNTREEKPLSLGSIDKDGYIIVTLYREGVGKQCKLHRLVAEVFISNPQRLPQINHKDENKANNCTDNLEWCSPLYNQRYGSRAARAGRKHRKKLLCIQTGEIFESRNEAAIKLNVSVSLISKCLSSKTKNKTAKGYTFEEV